MSSNSGSSPRAAVFTALLAVQVLFGVNYVVSKIVVSVFPPLVWASLRAVIAAVIMVGYCLATHRKHPTPNRSFFVPLIAFSLLGVIINQGSFLVGLHYTTSTNSSILNTLIPLFTLLFVTVRGQEPATPRRIVGFLFGFAGVLVLRKVEQLTLSDRTVIGDLLVILNCFSYGLFLAFGKKFLERNDAVWTTAWLFVYGSVGLTLLALPAWREFHWPALSRGLWVASIYAVLGATLLTYFLNSWALARARSSQVALFIYLQPVVTAIVAWAWFGQTPTLRTALATALIFAGMLLAHSPGGSLRRAPLTTRPLRG